MLKSQSLLRICFTVVAGCMLVYGVLLTIIVFLLKIGGLLLGGYILSVFVVAVLASAAAANIHKMVC